MKWIWFHTCKLFIPYSHFRLVICFPPTCRKQVIIFDDSQKKGWKVVLQKDPCGRQMIEIIQIDPMEFDVFWLDNIDDYTCL